MVIIPAIVKRLAVCFGLCSFALSAPAATYYIDFAGGSDSNSGTSTSSPWQRAPGMNGFSHAYIHGQGDRFIFKGGVTWPRSCFTFSISQGGSSISNRDYYGADSTWFSGGSFTRPLFDLQNGNPGGGSPAIAISHPYVQLDNIEIANYSATDGNNVMITAINGTAAPTITISNCLIRDIQHCTGIQAYSCLLEVTGCEFHQLGLIHVTPGGTKLVPSTIQTWNVPLVKYCHVHDCGSFMAGGGGTYHHNHFHDMYGMYVTGSPDVLDTSNHANVFQMFTPFSIHHNLIHDLAPIISPSNLYPGGNTQGSDGYTGSAYYYDNVVYNCAQGVGFATTQGCNAKNITVYMFNNTLRVGQAGVQGDQNASQFRFAAAYVQNNHFIDTTNFIMSGVTATPVVDHNLFQTSAQASAAGYTASNVFKPTSSSAPTVNQGIDLSAHFTTDRLDAARTVPWDIGAYEYGGVGPVNTPTPTPAPTANPSPTTTPAPTAQPTPTPTATPPLGPTVAGLSFNATDGIITPPFVATGGGISQGLQTADPTAGGRAAYTFDVSIAGDYGIVTDVNCPTEGNNSFFINIDAEPSAPLMIWDVGVTNGVESRIVSWRGTGTDTSDQFSPKIFTLTQGTHQLILRGRETASEIDHITLVKVPSPPANLSVRP